MPVIEAVSVEMPLTSKLFLPPSFNASVENVQDGTILLGAVSVRERVSVPTKVVPSLA